MYGDCYKGGECECGRVNVIECNVVNIDVSSDDLRVVISDRLVCFLFFKRIWWYIIFIIEVVIGLVSCVNS